jgi:large subunit ribosomal protein L24
MKIKKGDNVIVISGKDKGKTGAVVKSFPKDGKVLVEGVNIKIIHQRPGKNIQKGQKIEKPMPFNVSNVMIVDPKTKKPTRVKFSMEKGKKFRITTKSGTKLQ